MNQRPNLAMKKIMFAAIIAAAGAMPARAASEADFKAAFAAADSAEKEAGRLRDQWITTEAALTAAKKAAETGNFDQAVKSAQEAEALAKASIFQATSEKERWKDMEIR
jgi:acetyl-CoA carboxylase carboxyltransferase component